MKEFQFMQKASEDYFNNQEQGVRYFKKSEKTFTWTDVWPFYRQTMEEHYQGPMISDSQHIENVKIHLYEEWIKEYPHMPHLPFLVSVKLYFDICKEIKPYVLQKVAERK